MPTKFYSDFSGYTLNAQPSDWTKGQDPDLSRWWVITDAGGTGGVVLRGSVRIPWLGDSNSVLSTLLWSGLGSHSDWEIATRFRVSIYGWAGQTPLVARGQLALDSSSYQTAVSSGGARRLDRHTGKNAYATLASGSGGLTLDTWNGSRLTVIGGLVTWKLWVWNDAAADKGESTAVTYSATDGSPLAAGYVGVGFNGDTPQTSHSVDFDVVGVTTSPATERAPLVPFYDYVRTAETNVELLEGSVGGVVVSREAGADVGALATTASSTLHLSQWASCGTVDPAAWEPEAQADGEWEPEAQPDPSGWDPC